MTAHPIPELTPLQARVLGVLVEKEKTVPDTYPLTLNALTAGCNQKSSRDPVMNATESEVREAVDELRRVSLVIESSGGRTMRYAQNVGRVLGLPSQSVALLAMLCLRGPQTAGELRLHCDRLHRFVDISSVEAFLAELAGREEGPMVVELARQPGARENRWMHRLCGEPAEAAVGAGGQGDGGMREGGARDGGHAQAAGSLSDADAALLVELLERVERLEQEVEALKRR
ncbi:MAG: YceH family protein [Burkholderiaceae bacterium]